MPIEPIRSQFPMLRQPGLHYLDSAATSQIPEVVLEALVRFETEQRANLHSEAHCLSRAAEAAYEGARAEVARLINAASPREIVFTYGATSAINLVAHSLGATMHAGDEVVISYLEHHANIVPWHQLACRRGVRLRFIPVTPDGRLDLTTLDDLVTDRCRLIAVTHTSNVTGAVTDVAALVAAARRAGALVMLDGAQRVAHGPVDVCALDVDFYAFSGHKMYGPTGIGVLWGRLGLLGTLPPFLGGGRMASRITAGSVEYAPVPLRFEAGTPPIAAAVGLGAAANWYRRQDWPALAAAERRHTARILDYLSARPDVQLLGQADLRNRLGIIAFHVHGMPDAGICAALDARGVSVRVGDHCAQPLLAAMGVTGAVRASLAAYTDDADVDALLRGLAAILPAT